MHKQLKLDNLGGLKFSQTELDLIQKAYTESIEVIAALLGDYVIVTGCVESAGQVSDGWLVYNGELLPFVGGAAQSRVLVSEVVTTTEYENSPNQNFLTERKAVLGISGGMLRSSFKRLDSYKTVLQDIEALESGKQNKLTDTYVSTNLGTMNGQPIEFRGQIAGNIKTVEFEFKWDESKRPSWIPNGTNDPVELFTIPSQFIPQNHQFFFCIDSGYGVVAMWIEQSTGKVYYRYNKTAAIFPEGVARCSHTYR